MARFFRRVTGKTCNQEDCTLQGQSVEMSQARCEECGRPLFELTAPNRPLQLLVALLSSGALAGLIGYGAFTWVHSRPGPAKAPPPQSRVANKTGPPQRSLADAQRQLAAKLREIYQDGQVGAAEQAELDKLLAGDPALAQAYGDFQRNRLPHIVEACRRVRTGQALVAQKLFGHAREDFLKATEEDPGNANAWAALGGVNVLTHREEEARQAYERALAADPQNWTAHYNYAFYFARKGETEAAFQHLDRAVALLGRYGNVDRAAVLQDLRTNPVLEPLRRDPRFARLLG